MSTKDPKEHLKTYEKFCAPRFGTIESKVDSLNQIVNDGLTDKVKELKEQSKWLLRLLISLLMLIIASTITLYATNQNKVDRIYAKIERLLDDN